MKDFSLIEEIAYNLQRMNVIYEEVKRLRRLMNNAELPAASRDKETILKVKIKEKIEYYEKILTDADFIV